MRLTKSALTTPHARASAAFYSVDIGGGRVFADSAKNFAFGDLFATAHDFSVGRIALYDFVFLFDGKVFEEIIGFAFAAEVFILFKL